THATTRADQVPQDVELDAEVVRDDEMRCATVRGGHFLRRRVAAAEAPRPLGPVVCLGARDLLDEVAPDETGRLLRLAHETLRIEVDAREHRLLRADVAQVADEGPGVDALDALVALPRYVRYDALL